MRRPHLVLAAPLLLALTTCAAAPTSTAIHDTPAPPPAPPTSTAIHDAPAPPPAPPTSTAIHAPPPAPAPRLDVRAGPVVADDPPQPAPDHSVESVAPPPTAPTTCCRRCHKGKACGNTCIAADKRCEHPPGCACDV